MGSRAGAREIAATRFQTVLERRPANGRRMRRGRDKRGRNDTPPPALFTERLMPPPLSPDPVQIAVLTLEYLSRATLRASFTGKEVQVAAPDAATAAIFRAALSQTARTRTTDRLIRVVVD